MFRLFLVLFVPFGAGEFLFKIAEHPMKTPLDTQNGVGKSLADRLTELISAASTASTVSVAGEPRSLLKTGENGVRGDELVRQKLMRGASLFDEAATEASSAEEKSLKQEIISAMTSNTTVSIPSLPFPDEMTQQSCNPDFQRCPTNFVLKGSSLCFPTAAYQGKCAGLDLTMSSAQKMAWTSACGTDFPCQENCEQDFDSISCPSLWKETSVGLCRAPTNFGNGKCAVFNTTGMTIQDKLEFGARCGASWPCKKASVSNYRVVCPDSWKLGHGKTCYAPQSYEGPCEPVKNMDGMDANAKKRFEVECLVQYPTTGPVCARDYRSSCPRNWFENTASECIAPVSTAQNQTCNKVQYLKDLTPEEKKDFEILCDVKWPCKQDSPCQRSYNSPCPSSYYSYSGTSCFATARYQGPCSRILHNLIDLSQEEKIELERKCEFRWPCAEEVEVEDPSLTIKHGAWRNELNTIELMALDGPVV